MSIITILLAIFALGVLVFIHELGHYYAAKAVGMRVEAFSIGFGRPILKWRVGEVDWQVGWLPFGGFVRIAGMEFGKNEKKGEVDPYSIPGGFFSKSPWRRIFVALAGPFANFILAFLLFIVLWFGGGREKPFSEFTHVIGWVDPASELYTMGVRPGDILTEYNGKPYTNSRDLLYAALFSGKKVELKGYHVNWRTGEREPFTVNVAPYPTEEGIEGMMTTGIKVPARFLIFEKNGLSYLHGSPMEKSGVQPGDQLVWADGDRIFSEAELSNLLNRNYSLLTIERAGERFLTRQPRIPASDLIIPSSLKGELVDVQYELGSEKEWNELVLIPYKIDHNGVVKGSLSFIDQESEQSANSYWQNGGTLTSQLKADDRILAIDGKPFTSFSDLLVAMQEHQVNLIVKCCTPSGDLAWNNSDPFYLATFKEPDFQKLAALVGIDPAVKERDGYRLLNPVVPTTYEALSPEVKTQLDQGYELMTTKAAKIRDTKKRAQTLFAIEKEKKRRILGLPWNDEFVKYNPNPIVSFVDVFNETFGTLKALVMGSVNPKWLSGPVGIVQVINQSWKVGIKEALFWIAAISINLGVLNLMPIPMLDGGHILFSAFEGVTRKKLKPRTMEKIIIPFAVLIIGLIVYLTLQDISRFF